MSQQTSGFCPLRKLMPGKTGTVTVIASSAFVFATAKVAKAANTVTVPVFVLLRKLEFGRQLHGSPAQNQNSTFGGALQVHLEYLDWAGQCFLL